MLKNAYLLAKIGADTAENERKFAKISPKKWQLPYQKNGNLLQLARSPLQEALCIEQMEQQNPVLRAWDAWKQSIWSKWKTTESGKRLRHIPKPSPFSEHVFSNQQVTKIYKIDLNRNAFAAAEPATDSPFGSHAGAGALREN